MKKAVWITFSWLKAKKTLQDDQRPMILAKFPLFLRLLGDFGIKIKKVYAIKPNFPLKGKLVQINLPHIEE